MLFTQSFALQHSCLFLLPIPCNTSTELEGDGEGGGFACPAGFFLSAICLLKLRDGGGGGGGVRPSRPLS